MELEELAKELRVARESDRTERRDDNEKLHGRVDALGKTMNRIDKKTVQIEGKVDTHASIQKTQGAEIERLRVAKGSPSPEGPNAVRAVKEKVSEASWTKLGTVIGGVLAGLLTAGGLVSSAMTAQSDQIEAVHAQQVVIQKRAVVSEADRLAELEAQLATMKAQNQATKAVATLDPLEEQKAAAEAEKADRKIEQVAKGLKQRRMAAAAAPVEK